MTLAEHREQAERVQEIREKMDVSAAEKNDVRDFEDRAPALIAALCRVVEAGDKMRRGTSDGRDCFDNARYDLGALLREVDGG